MREEHYLELDKEERASNQAVEAGLVERSHQEIVNDAISLFKSDKVLRYSPETAKEILKEISRLKRISDEQKRFLYSFLMLNNDQYRDRHYELFKQFI